MGTSKKPKDGGGSGREEARKSMAPYKIPALRSRSTQSTGPAGAAHGSTSQPSTTGTQQAGLSRSGSTASGPAACSSDRTQSGSMPRDMMLSYEDQIYIWFQPPPNKDQTTEEARIR